MSRHAIDPHTQYATHAVVVGWDNPLETYFFQVFDYSITDPEKDDCIVWEGTRRAAIPTLDALITAVAPYATIPRLTQITLKAEYDARTAPTPLQRWADRLLKN